jgi:hypothetical protein
MTTPLPRPTPPPPATPHPALALLGAIWSAIGAWLGRVGRHIVIELDHLDDRPARRQDCAARQLMSAFDCGFYSGCVILAVFLCITLW